MKRGLPAACRYTPTSDEARDRGQVGGRISGARRHARAVRRAVDEAKRSLLDVRTDWHPRDLEMFGEVFARLYTAAYDSGIKAMWVRRKRATAKRDQERLAS